MICISISQESRWFALVDMYNARSQCDLLEVRLDRFVGPADVGELLASKPKPVIMTCRRADEGGDWSGMEEDRIALLKHCIACKADYVEVELDIADQVPVSPHSKRVIAYTNSIETPSDLAEIYARAVEKKPDVIKLVLPARTPEEVWPVVQVLGKPAVPTVVVGLGKPGVMLAIMARKMGAPWVYAALERGMEAYYGQPTVSDLEKVYHYRAIERGTRLVGVTGAGDLQYLTIGLLNAALAQLGQPLRCLPLEIGDLHMFRRILDALKLVGVIVGEEHRESIGEIATEQEPVAQAAKSIDFMAQQGGKWHGYNLLYRAALAALEGALRSKAAKDKPLTGRTVLVAASGGVAQPIAARLKQAGATVRLTSRDTYAGEQLAQAVGCPFLATEAVPTTPHDIFILGEVTGTHDGVQPEHLPQGATVLDLTALPRKSPFLVGAADRGCNVVSPPQVLVELVVRQAKTLTGKDIPPKAMAEVLPALMGDWD
jgi:3-dehydroquinate dehydratase/shikimate dehydrogenase